MKEGTKKLVDKYGETKNNVTDFTERLKRMVEAAQRYKSFTGKSDDVNGSVEFIIKTDAN